MVLFCLFLKDAALLFESHNGKSMKYFGKYIPNICLFNTFLLSESIEILNI